MLPSEALLRPFVVRQNGAVTVSQAFAAGCSRQQLRTLVNRGRTSPLRGVLIEPRPVDPFRAGVRAALLVSPDAATCRITAARLRGWSGLPLWSPAELPQLLLPTGTRRAPRRGARTHAGLRENERCVWRGWPMTTVSRTVADLSATLGLDDLVCLIDSALHAGEHIRMEGLSARVRSLVETALVLSDGRSESALETVIRLLLTRAGLTPETLQHRLFNNAGWCYARVDLAWPSRKVALEADGRAYHDLPEAVYRDRVRQNELQANGWTVFRFTWKDVFDDPDEIVRRVAEAVGLQVARGSGWPKAI